MCFVYSPTERFVMQIDKLELKSSLSLFWFNVVMSWWDIKNYSPLQSLSVKKNFFFLLIF